MSKYVDNIEFITEECCSCGIPFALTADFQRRRLNDHEWFYCPAGHGQHYTGKSEAQKLKEQLEHKQRELQRQQINNSELRAQKNQLSKTYQRMRERVKNGVCPCCNRTFQNLLEHMKTQHPDYGSHQTLKALRLSFGLTQAGLANEIGLSPSYISLFECGEPVPYHAEFSINQWMESDHEK